MSTPNHARNDLAAAAARFRHPDASAFGPVPIWWWSGAALESGRLRWQMEQMLSQGVAQAVILNLAPTGPLYGSLADDPPFMSEAWWAIFLQACEDADDLGFGFWPYDQIGFSGANLQGRLVTEHPEWAGRALGRLSANLDAGDAPQLQVPMGGTLLGAYLMGAEGDIDIDADQVRTTSTAGTLHLVYAQTRGFDYFNPAASAGLIDTVHGEFARRAGTWFGSVIVGFFQDELPAMPTWSPGFAEGFAEQYGYDLLPMIGALWGDDIAGDRDARDVRLHYQEHRARLASAATFGPLAAWFDEHGLICGFDQQSPAREGDPAGTTRLYGNYLELHGTYGAPGSDHWGDAKIHSSLAHASGAQRTWLEAFHSSGWGGTLEETYDWLAAFLRRGATLYSPHAVYYSTSGAWWEWAPPSTCWRQPYWPEYHELSGAVARLQELLTAGRHVADTVLVFPTSTMQSTVTVDGRTLADGEAAGELYHALNGNPAWYAERPGVLDAAGHDYDIFDETVVASATVRDGTLVIADETYRNVILPGMTTILAGVAEVLADLVESGGRVVVVGPRPTRVAGGADGARFLSLIASGRVTVVDEPVDAVPALERGPVWVDAEVPHLLRQVGDGWVVTLFAHDDISGTVQPIVTGGGSGIEWIETTWDQYWNEISENGYTYRPVRDRVEAVTLHGLLDARVEVWDPRTGDARGLAPRTGAPQTWDVRFDAGTVAVLAITPGVAGDAPEAQQVEVRAIPLSGWELTAASGLDNTHGDFADRERTGVLPIEVWEFDHWTDVGAVERVTATFGPFADATDPLEPDASAEPAWHPVAWSLSRGIEQDPVHGDSLGPKGYVPEEFLVWPAVRMGQRVGVRTSIDVPAAGLVLAIGANAEKRVLLDGHEVDLSGSGYLATCAVEPGGHSLEVWLHAERDETIRAAFSLVADLAVFRRPEWVEPDGPAREATTFALETDIVIDEVPDDARILVGSEQPTTLLVNGVEIGRQSDFDPYAERRFGRIHAYDLRDVLRPGSNVLRLESREGTRPPAVLIDSARAERGGLGVMTGQGEWRAVRDRDPIGTRLRSRQWQDPRFVCLEAKPHPLPAARWLERTNDEGAVLELIPDRDPADRRDQYLRFALPVGATAVQVHTVVPFTAEVDGHPVAVNGGRMSWSAPVAAGVSCVLRFTTIDGRRAGALLERAVEVETAAAPAPLVPWAELGLSDFAGTVTYRSVLPTPEVGDDERVVLDLGEVRGSASVRIGGEPAGRLAWSPYRLDVTDLVRGATGDLAVEVDVRNTLAGYMTHASPTPAVFAGQVRSGMFGPVLLRVTGAEHG